jgi:hypothetical protein
MDGRGEGWGWEGQGPLRGAAKIVREVGGRRKGGGWGGAEEPLSRVPSHPYLRDSCTVLRRIDAPLRYAATGPANPMHDPCTPIVAQ